MKFIPIASSSKGNAYLLQAEGTQPLLLEAGLPIGRLRDKLREHGVSLSDLAGCLVSHEHQDHSKAVKDLLKLGVDCYMSYGTAKTLGIMKHHRNHLWDTYLEPLPIQGGYVTAFPLEHDATDPIGFYIAYENDRFLFIPDTAYVKNRFHGITMIGVECNFLDEILSKNIQEENLPQIIGRRVRRSHFSLKNVISFLKSNDLSKCRELWLLHLSDGNSSEEMMKKKIQEATGIPVYVASE